MEEFKSEKETLLMVLFISVVLFGLGLFFTCLSAWYDKPTFDYVAIFCWIASALPFMLLQFFIPFRVKHYFGTFWDIMLLISFCLFEVMVNAWFIFWLGTILSLYQNPAQFVFIVFFGSLGLFCLLFDLGLLARLVIEKKNIRLINRL